MLFLVFGSSWAGKTTALSALRGRVAGLTLHDFDELGVPPGADLAWRHRANERWVRRAVAYEAQGTDMLLAGQTPLGELLAAPSAPRLEAVSACLLDCDDVTRTARIEARGAGWRAGDPRWRVRTIDTSTASAGQVADRIAAWIDDERALLRSGAHPLARAASSRRRAACGAARPRRPPRAGSGP